MPLVLRDREEVRERYQEAVVHGRSLGWTVNDARSRGQFEYLAEYEAARYDGVASAMKWVLGAAPVSPCTDQLILVPTAAQVEAEAQAAEVELQALIARYGEPFDLTQTTRPAVVHGVASSLRWVIVPDSPR